MADYRHAVLATGIAFSIISVAAVTLRCHARQLQRVGLGVDDWAIVIALILALVTTADYFVSYSISNLGGHQAAPLVTGEAAFVKNQNFWITAWIFQIMLVPCLGFTKASTLLFFARIFPGERFAWWTRIWLGVVVVWTVAFFLVCLLECIPVQAAWDPALVAGRRCLNPTVAFGANYIVSLVLTLAIVTLPIYRVAHLQLPTRRKVGIILLFLMSCGTLTAGLVRSIAVVHAYAQIGGGDDPYNFAPVLFWSIVQIHLGIASASLPSLPPVFTAYGLDRFLRKVFSGTWRSSESRRSYLSLENTTPAAREGGQGPGLENKEQGQTQWNPV